MTDSADRVLDTVRGLIPGMAATFGRSCEVVLHDYRTPERSVIAVAGDVTGRQVGDGMSDIGRRVLVAGDAATTDLNYLTRTPGGTVLKSTTIPLRDDAGRLIGALCINVDVTALGRISDAVNDLIGLPGTSTDESAPVTEFTAGLVERTDRIIEQHERDAGVPARAFDRGTRVAAIRDLANAAVFEMRGAAAVVAARLDVSRAGLYNDLRKIRETLDAVSE
ncbi:helix-turn-helix transcriptional regulator [Agromyces sp. SYSU K20354]|uniref:helix-turn-helix transcriptional regulator n=1 Tax=Agromyces cavernae TaxID=2898659 RepID=UPI001E5FBBD0|nr:PAS domain-containing protein [Agromyces cavernae]MCD2442026.1 helix-turn-helix transcriptional regulator [Agromyces cavernae]